MTEIIEILNSTSPGRTFFYLFVFIISLIIITHGVTDIVYSITNIFRKNDDNQIEG